MITDRTGAFMESVMIGVRVICPGADAEQINEFAHNLREAVIDSDVDDVRLGTERTAPAGAKSGELLAIGALAVTLAPTVVESLMALVSSWLSRQPSDVEVEIDGHRF